MPVLLLFVVDMAFVLCCLFIVKLLIVVRSQILSCYSVVLMTCLFRFNLGTYVAFVLLIKHSILHSICSEMMKVHAQGNLWSMLCNVVDCYARAGCNELSLDMSMEMVEVLWCSLQVASSNGA